MDSTLLDNAFCLELEINSGDDPEFIAGLAKQFEACTKAKQRFFSGQISLSDYLDVLSDNGVEMDAFIGNAISWLPLT